MWVGGCPWQGPARGPNSGRFRWERGDHFLGASRAVRLDSMRAWCMAVLAALLVGCGGGDAGGTPAEVSVSCADEPRADAYVATMTKAGKNGELNITLVSSDPAPPAKGDNDWVLEILDADNQPVPGATLTVTPSMPDEGHGTPSTSSSRRARATASTTPLRSTSGCPGCGRSRSSRRAATSRTPRCSPSASKAESAVVHPQAEASAIQSRAADLSSGTWLTHAGQRGRVSWPSSSAVGVPGDHRCPSPPVRRGTRAFGGRSIVAFAMRASPSATPSTALISTSTRSARSCELPGRIAGASSTQFPRRRGPLQRDAHDARGPQL